MEALVTVSKSWEDVWKQENASVAELLKTGGEVVSLEGHIQDGEPQGDLDWRRQVHGRKLRTALWVDRTSWQCRDGVQMELTG